jgi:hypothetical protein
VQVELSDSLGCGPVKGSPFHVRVQPREHFGGAAPPASGSSSSTGGKSSAAQMQEAAIRKKKASDEGRKQRLRDMQAKQNSEQASEKARFQHQQSERHSNDGKEQWSNAQQTAEEERRRMEARRKFKEQYRGASNSQKRRPPPSQQPRYDPSQGYGSYEHPNHNSYAKFAHDFSDHGNSSSGGGSGQSGGSSPPPPRSSYVPQASASPMDPAKAKDVAKWTERLRRFEEISIQSDQPGERKNAERLAKDARQRLDKLKSS